MFNKGDMVKLPRGGPALDSAYPHRLYRQLEPGRVIQFVREHKSHTFGEVWVIRLNPPYGHVYWLAKTWAEGAEKVTGG